MIDYKAVPVGGVEVLDRDAGVISAIVSVTGIEDHVKDVIVPGAYAETLKKRTPKGVWHHDWKQPIAKTLEIEELMPGDSRLPPTLPNGEPWPADAGALKAVMQFNLGGERGKQAFADVEFFGGEQEWSIGYQVQKGKATTRNGIRYIKGLECYEYSPVLFGAMPAARTVPTVKEAQQQWAEIKGELYGACADGDGTCCAACGVKAIAAVESKVYQSGWNEALHPRDAQGKFTDSPGEAAMKRALDRVKKGVETVAERIDRFQMDEGDIDDITEVTFGANIRKNPVDPNAPRKMVGGPGEAMRGVAGAGELDVIMATADAVQADDLARRLGKDLKIPEEEIHSFRVLSAGLEAAKGFDNPEDRLQALSNYGNGAELIKAYDQTMENLGGATRIRRGIRQQAAQDAAGALQVGMINTFGQGWKGRVRHLDGPKVPLPGTKAGRAYQRQVDAVRADAKYRRTKREWRRGAINLGRNLAIGAAVAGVVAVAAGDLPMPGVGQAHDAFKRRRNARNIRKIPGFKADPAMDDGLSDDDVLTEDDLPLPFPDLVTEQLLQLPDEIPTYTPADRRDASWSTFMHEIVNYIDAEDPEPDDAEAKVLLSTSDIADMRADVAAMQAKAAAPPVPPKRKPKPDEEVAPNAPDAEVPVPDAPDPDAPDAEAAVPDDTAPDDTAPETGLLDLPPLPDDVAFDPALRANPDDMGLVSSQVAMALYNEPPDAEGDEPVDPNAPDAEAAVPDDTAVAPDDTAPDAEAPDEAPVEGDEPVDEAAVDEGEDDEATAAADEEEIAAALAEAESGKKKRKPETKAYNGGWEEAKHPRDQQGKFSDTPGEAAAKKAFAKMKEGAESLEDKVSRLKMDEPDLDDLDDDYGFTGFERHPVDVNAPRISRSDGLFHMEDHGVPQMQQHMQNEQMLTAISNSRLGLTGDDNVAIQSLHMSNVAASLTKNPADRMAAASLHSDDYATNYDRAIDALMTRGKKRKRPDMELMAKALQRDAVDMFGPGWRKRTAGKSFDQGRIGSGLDEARKATKSLEDDGDVTALLDDDPLFAMLTELAEGVDHDDGEEGDDDLPEEKVRWLEALHPRLRGRFTESHGGHHDEGGIPDFGDYGMGTTRGAPNLGYRLHPEARMRLGQEAADRSYLHGMDLFKRGERFEDAHALGNLMGGIAWASRTTDIGERHRAMEVMAGGRGQDWVANHDRAVEALLHRTRRSQREGAVSPDQLVEQIGRSMTQLFGPDWRGGSAAPRRRRFGRKDDDVGTYLLDPRRHLIEVKMVEYKTGDYEGHCASVEELADFDVMGFMSDVADAITDAGLPVLDDEPDDIEPDLDVDDPEGGYKADNVEDIEEKRTRAEWAERLHPRGEHGRFKRGIADLLEQRGDVGFEKLRGERMGRSGIDPSLPHMRSGLEVQNSVFHMTKDSFARRPEGDWSGKAHRRYGGPMAAIAGAMEAARFVPPEERANVLLAFSKYPELDLQRTAEGLVRRGDAEAGEDLRYGVGTRLRNRLRRDQPGSAPRPSSEMFTGEVFAKQFQSIFGPDWQADVAAARMTRRYERIDERGQARDERRARRANPYFGGNSAEDMARESEERHSGQTRRERTSYYGGVRQAAREARENQDRINKNWDDIERRQSEREQFVADLDREEAARAEADAIRRRRQGKDGEPDDLESKDGEPDEPAEPPPDVLKAWDDHDDGGDFFNALIVDLFGRDDTEEGDDDAAEPAVVEEKRGDVPFDEHKHPRGHGGKFASIGAAARAGGRALDNVNIIIPWRKRLAKRSFARNQKGMARREGILAKIQHRKPSPALSKLEAAMWSSRPLRPKERQAHLDAIGVDLPKLVAEVKHDFATNGANPRIQKRINRNLPKMLDRWYGLEGRSAAQQLKSILDPDNDEVYEAWVEYKATTMTADEVFDMMAKLDPAELEEVIETVEYKRAFSTAQRDKHAKKGKALPDGSFPIVTEADLRNAIQALGRSKNPAAAKAHIIKRARALHKVSILPDSWNVREGKEAMVR